MNYWLQSKDMLEEFEELKMCNLETVKERTYTAFEKNGNSMYTTVFNSS